jgi:hypothetical protein
MLALDNITTSKHLSFRQKASWLMLGNMPIVAMCIVITITFRFTRSNTTTLDIYSWISLCVHFILARYTALYSPGAGHVTPLYLAWRDSTAFFTYISIHLFTLWTAVTRSKAKFVTTGKESNDAEAGRWHPLCWWNVMLSIVTGTSLVWLTDESVCNSVTTFGAFIFALYIFISNWDVLSVILNPMTRWPLDPYANNTTIVVEPYVPRVVSTLPMLDGITLNSNTVATALPSPTAAAVAHQQEQQHMMAPVATVKSKNTATTTTSSSSSSTAVAAAAPVRHSKSFMRWYSGARGLFILMIVISHIQTGLSNSGVEKTEDQWGTWIGMSTWLSAMLWPLGASHSVGFLGTRGLTFCTGFGLSMSCSRRDVSFGTVKEYIGFVKTRLHRLLLLCYISIAVYVLQDMTNGTFEFTNKEHWIDLVYTLTFTSQFTTKYFFPRVNGVLWYIGQLIISCIISFPIMHAAMRKVGPVLPYAIASAVSALVRYYGVLYYPDAQLTATHHVVSSSFMGFLVSLALECSHIICQLKQTTYISHYLSLQRAKWYY